MAAPTFYDLIRQVLHTDLAHRTFFDLDGVLAAECCYNEPDVASYQELVDNHQNSAYWHHLHHGHPYLIPTRKVLGVVTGRMEFYRGPTQQWLQRQGIWPLLPMQMSKHPRPGARPRREEPNNTAHEKAAAYAAVEAAELFVESKRWQAKQIHEITGKPVLCTHDLRLYGEWPRGI
jgi:hypothetical protein